MTLYQKITLDYKINRILKGKTNIKLLGMNANFNQLWEQV